MGDTLWVDVGAASQRDQGSLATGRVWVENHVWALHNPHKGLHFKVKNASRASGNLHLALHPDAEVPTSSGTLAPGAVGGEGDNSWRDHRGLCHTQQRSLFGGLASNSAMDRRH